VKDLEERLRNHNVFTPPRVNQRQPDATMTQNEIILKVLRFPLIKYGNITVSE